MTTVCHGQSCLERICLISVHLMQSCQLRGAQTLLHTLVPWTLHEAAAQTFTYSTVNFNGHTAGASATAGRTDGAWPLLDHCLCVRPIGCALTAPSAAVHRRTQPTGCGCMCAHCALAMHCYKKASTHVLATSGFTLCPVWHESALQVHNAHSGEQTCTRLISCPGPCACHFQKHSLRAGPATGGAAAARGTSAKTLPLTLA